MASLKGAMVGYGFIANQGHLPAIRNRIKHEEDIELVAVADVSPQRRELITLQLPAARIYEDSTELFKNESSIDFLVICTPPSEHAKLASEALDRGLHVLCEKPLCTSSREVWNLLEMAKRNHRVLFPCHNYHYAPVVSAATALLDAGKIGDVRALTLNTYRNSHARGVTEWRTDWRRERQYSGGGILMDHASHSLYLAFSWMNSYPTSVTAKTAQLNPLLGDTEDTAVLTLEFPNGWVNSYLTWVAGIRKAHYVIQGTNGGIQLDNDQLELWVKNGAYGARQKGGGWQVEVQTIASAWMDAGHASWFSTVYAEFLNAIQNKDFAGKHAFDAYCCVRVIEAAYQSAANKCKEMPLSIPSFWRGKVPGT